MPRSLGRPFMRWSALQAAAQRRCKMRCPRPRPSRRQRWAQQSMLTLALPTSARVLPGCAEMHPDRWAASMRPGCRRPGLACRHFPPSVDLHVRAFTRRITLPICLQEEEETYYDAMKRDLAERAAKTKAALDALDPVTRVAMEVGAAPSAPACCGRAGLVPFRCRRSARGAPAHALAARRQWSGCITCFPLEPIHHQHPSPIPVRLAGPPSRRVCAAAFFRRAVRAGHQL